jgi:glutamate/tyrosine decarboxylase-like PLP-dependent enzyme
VIKIRTDESGRMIPEELESEIRKSIEEGKVPMMVNATSGTTVCGAYDDLVKLFWNLKFFNSFVCMFS